MSDEPAISRSHYTKGIRSVPIEGFPWRLGRKVIEPDNAKWTFTVQPASTLYHRAVNFLRPPPNRPCVPASSPIPKTDLSSRGPMRLASSLSCLFWDIFAIEI
jgi:hypothetical protein